MQGYELEWNGHPWGNPYDNLEEVMPVVGYLDRKYPGSTFTVFEITTIRKEIKINVTNKKGDKNKCYI